MNTSEMFSNEGIKITFAHSAPPVLVSNFEVAICNIKIRIFMRIRIGNHIHRQTLHFIDELLLYEISSPTRV